MYKFVIPTERSEWRDLSHLINMKKQYYVYILRNFSGNFYIGITSNLIKRVWEHKTKLVEGFTKKYNINLLIYYEIFSDPETAIIREKQLKNWSRKKKIVLITKMNPKFEEISLDTLVS
jgi:putative endonuclease